MVSHVNSGTCKKVPRKPVSLKTRPLPAPFAQSARGWRLQFDALGFLDLRLSGGARKGFLLFFFVSVLDDAS